MTVFSCPDICKWGGTDVYFGYNNCGVAGTLNPRAFYYTKKKKKKHIVLSFETFFVNN